MIATRGRVYPTKGLYYSNESCYRSLLAPNCFAGVVLSPPLIPLTHNLEHDDSVIGEECRRCGRRYKVNIDRNHLDDIEGERTSSGNRKIRHNLCPQRLDGVHIPRELRVLRSHSHHPPSHPYLLLVLFPLEHFFAYCIVSLLIYYD